MISSYFKRQEYGNKKAGDGKPVAKSSPQLDSSSSPLPLVKLEWEGWFGEKALHWKKHTWTWKHHQLSSLGSWSVKERPAQLKFGPDWNDGVGHHKNPEKSKSWLPARKSDAWRCRAYTHRWLKDRAAGRLLLALLTLSISCVFWKKKKKSIFASHWDSFYLFFFPIFYFYPAPLSNISHKLNYYLPLLMYLSASKLLLSKWQKQSLSFHYNYLSSLNTIIRAVLQCI